MKKFTICLAAIFIFLLQFAPANAEQKNIKPFAKDAVEKGWEYFNNGDLETALKRFHQATIIDPDFAPGYFGKAYIYSVQNNLDSAIDNYRKTIELADPPYSPAYANLGLALLLKGHNEEGHKMLLKALAVDQNNADAHLSIAQSFCAQKESRKAWAHLKKAQELQVDIPSEVLSEMNAECPKDN